MSSKSQPYQITFESDIIEDMADDISEYFQIMLTAKDIIACATLGNLHKRIVSLYEADETEQVKCASQMTFYRLRALLPDGDDLKPSTQLNTLKGFHYTRFKRQIYELTHLELPNSYPLTDYFPLTFALTFVGTGVLFTLMEPGFYSFFLSLMLSTTIVGTLLHMWFCRYPPKQIKTLGQLVQLTAGLSIPALETLGASVTDKLFWHGLKTVLVTEYAEDWHKLTPETRLA